MNSINAMTKPKEIICNRSGLVFTCQFLPISMKRSEVSHPLFHVSRRGLLGLTGQWANSELSNEETYLYFLALLDSSALMIWRHPAKFSAETLGMMNSSMEKLIRTIDRMDKLTSTNLKQLPHYTITPDTANLLSIPHFLDSWNSAISESIKGYKSVDEIYEEQAKESAIERLIKSPHRNSDKGLANKLADWAAIAGNFPEFETTSPNGTKISLRELWKEIIRACVDDDRVFNIPRKDLEELIEHLIDNVPQGSIHITKLHEFLRNALNKKVDYQSLGFGSENLAGKTTAFSIVRNSSDRPNATIHALIQDAPANEPQRKDFKTLAEFLRAKSRWSLSKNHAPVNGGMASEVKEMLSAQIIDDSTEEEEDIDPLDDPHNPDYYPSDDDMA